MTHGKHLDSRLMPAAALAAFACLALAGCKDDKNGMRSAPAQPDPLAVYPTVHIQNAAPTAADFIQDAELGTLLTATVGGQQLTLYTFANDVTGISNCAIKADYTGSAKHWRPLFAGNTSAAQDDFTIITRNDGLRQWAWRGHGLYFFAGGTAPGAATPAPADARTGDTNG